MDFTGEQAYALQVRFLANHHSNNYRTTDSANLQKGCGLASRTTAPVVLVPYAPSRPGSLHRRAKRVHLCLVKDGIHLLRGHVKDIGPGEALVKVDACGICGSDGHAYLSGRLFPIGTVMGHEAAGTVVKVGQGVQRF